MIVDGATFVASRKGVMFMSRSLEGRADRTRGDGLAVLLGAVASVVALAGLAGCGGGKNEAHGVVAVAGSQECTSFPNEVYRCVNSMSDARVSGTEEVKLRLEWSGGGEPSAVAFSGPATLSNDKGTWRGTSRGAYVLTDPSGENRNYARTEYRGEGAYEGLRYVEMIAGNDQTLEVTGWIEPAR